MPNNWPAWGQTAGMPPEPFEQGWYLRLDAFDQKHIILGIKALRTAFGLSLHDAKVLACETPLPAHLPWGPYRPEEAQAIIRRLSDDGNVTVSLVATKEAPIPKTAWERLRDDDE